MQLTDIAPLIDHTFLKPAGDRNAVVTLCREAKRAGFASVCVNPAEVETAARQLRGSGVKVCTVIGFPLGANTNETKCFEAFDAIRKGAEELDLVVNQRLLKYAPAKCEAELLQWVRTCRTFRSDVVLKLILECCNLTDAEIVRGSQMAKRVGFDFVKTSTGFGAGGATIEEVRLMRKTVGAEMGVKAAGGIRDLAAAKAMIDAGATRIGTSAGMKMLGLAAAALLALTAVAERSVTDLSGAGWTADGAAVTVPHCWNAVDGQDGPNGQPSVRYETSADAESYARKIVRYARDLPDAKPGRRYFLRFGGASQRAEVWVNGRCLGSHFGAFTAFAFEATAALKPTGNRLEVVVDNTYDADIPPIAADFTVFGGLYRAVTWLETDPICIDPVTDGADGVVLDVDSTTGKVRARVRVLGGQDEVQEFSFPGFQLWSPENPRTYEVKVTIAQQGSTDSVTIPFGFSRHEFRADGYYLNGVKRKLRGVNRHQDRYGKGWAISAADETEDIAIIKEMGADALRTAHYPQTPHLYDLCDREGLITWVEYPCVDFVTTNAAYRLNCRSALREMIAQHRHHPSIFGWSIYNELYNAHVTNQVDLFVGFTREMNAYAHELDATRPTLAASHRLEPELLPLNAVTDQLAFNRYPGWYDERDAKTVFAEMFAKAGRATLGLSEYGVGASIKQHGALRKYVEPGGAWHPEEYQAYRLHDTFRTIQAEERLWGSFVWAMFDFGSDHRTEGDRHGINDKGLVTYDRKVRKDAYYLYQANWTRRPVLHLVGSRMTEVDDAEVDLMVFSNLGKVTLKVNGQVVATRSPDEVCTVLFEAVPLQPGDNLIEVSAADRRMVRHWRRK